MLASNVVHTVEHYSYDAQQDADNEKDIEEFAGGCICFEDDFVQFGSPRGQGSFVFTQ